MIAKIALNYLSERGKPCPAAIIHTVFEHGAAVRIKNQLSFIFNGHSVASTKMHTG
jgi:hypothetical protein